MRIAMMADANSIHTSRIANGLARRGHKIKLFSMRPLHGQEYDSSVKVHGVFRDRELTRWEKIRFVLLVNLLSILFRPHIVNAHYAASYGRLSRFVFFQRKIISFWGSDLTRRMVVNKGIRIGVQSALRHSDAAMATSKFLAEEAIKYTDRAIFRTPFGIDTEKFSPSGDVHPKIVQIRKNFDLVVGCPKWLEVVYGIDTLIRAFDLVRLKLSSQKLALVLIDQGGNKAELHELVRQLGLEQSVFFLPVCSYEEMPGFYRGLDVAVVPSRRESFGVSILEASSTERAVVASRVEGIPEVVDDGQTGLLANVDDIPELADRMIALLSNKSLRAKLGLNGRNFVRNNYEWTKCLEKFEHVYSFVRSSRRLTHFIDAWPLRPPVDKRVVFHYPFPIELNKSAARPIRLRTIINYLSSRYSVIAIFGNTSDKLKKINELKYLKFSGSSIEYCYAETSSSPSINIKTVRSGDWTDYRFFLWLRKNGVKSGIFVRDYYANERSLREVVGLKKYIFLNIFQRIDFIVYNRLFDVIFVPTDVMGKRLARHFSKGTRIVALPPGQWGVVANKASHHDAPCSGVVKLLYVGGLGYHYDIRKALLAAALSPQHVQLDIVCRPQDLKAQNLGIDKLIKSPNIRVLHKDQEWLREHSGNWDFALLARQPHEYIQMAYPVKFSDYLDMGLPIIASKGQYVAELVERYGLGIVVNNDVRDLRRLFISLNEKNGPELRARFGSNVLRYVSDNSWNSRVDTISSALQ